MSPELKQFFLDINDWIEQGCPKHRVFLRTCGLCATAMWYAFELGLNVDHLEQELKTLMKAFNGASVFPFNPTGADYAGEQKAETIYQNPTRLAFIKKQVESIKNSVEEQLK